MSTPRILFVNRSYWPDTEATGQLLTELCTGISSEFDVEVIAGSPNHTEDEAQSTTVGNVRRNGVTITRVWHTRFSKSSTIGKLTNLITFTLSAFLVTLFRSPRPNVVVTETDPFFLPILGRWLRWWYGCRFVAYMQDVYPDVAVAVGQVREGFFIRCLRKLLVSSIRQADKVVALSEDMKARLIRNGVRPESIAIIPNWADCSLIKPCKMANQFRNEHGLAEDFVVMYSGNLGRAHLLSPLIEAAEQLRKREDIVFIIIGEGVQKQEMRTRAAELGLRNVRFLSYQPRNYLVHSLSAADVHIVSMKPETEGCVVPSKLYGILASGTAVISLCSQDADVSRVVDDHRVGRVCDPEPAETTSSRLAAIIEQMADHRAETAAQGKRARLLCEQQYDRPEQLRRFSDLLNQVVVGRLATSGPLGTRAPLPKEVCRTP